MNKQFIEAVEELETERGISKEVLFEAIESALISAYKKNYGAEGNVEVRIDRELGEVNVITRLEVVSEDELEDVSRQVSLEEAREIDPAYQVGDEMAVPVTPGDFGRIAAQTAKQVVVQRIREAERGMIYEDYIEKIGEVVTGTIQRKSNETIFVNMGKTEGILSVKEQVPGEHFDVNERIKVYIMDVKNSTKGPQVFLSRSHPGLVKRLFEMEVPEIEDGTVEIRSIAREAGSRTKIAVYTDSENVDPVGACVGSRGSRVQAVVDELFNEKIDIIVWSDDPKELIANVLSPAKVEEVIIEENEKGATVVVPDYQLSLAIGKAGQNVRLAAKLCGWKIDIKSHTQYFEGEDEEESEENLVEVLEEDEEVVEEAEGVAEDEEESEPDGGPAEVAAEAEESGDLDGYPAEETAEVEAEVEEPEDFIEAEGEEEEIIEVEE